MSASLVGSEMCIRDRYPSGVAQDSVNQEPFTVLEAPSCNMFRELCPRGACLLYTSDAADDM
eukprot:3827527-Alexandrium_andersonii.AAC.1